MNGLTNLQTLVLLLFSSALSISSSFSTLLLSFHVGTGLLKTAEEVAYGELQEATANCSERGGLPKALRTDKNEN